jgi:3-oxoadipate enol-lactonase
MPYQSANDIRIYYEQHGSEAAFPLLFINGLLADTTSWVLQRPHFDQHFRVVLYDCRGQGQSDKPPGPYAPTQHTEDLLALLDGLNIARAHIVGLSNGGTIAMQLAAMHPQRVARLVLADTFAYADSLMQAKLQSWLTALDAGGPLLRFDMATPWIWGRTFLATNHELIEVMRTSAGQANPDTIRALIQGGMQYDIREHLGAIRAPTLVVVGEEDVLTPPWYAREIAAAIPGAQLALLPQAGHVTVIEQADLFNALVLTFLSAQPG